MILSGFVYLFLTVFEPFGISEIEFYKPLILMGYGLITLLVSLLLFYLAPILFPKYFEEEEWTVKKTIVFVFWELLLISILNWLYTASFDREIIEKEFSFFQFAFFTVAIGALAMTFLILVSERWLNRRNQLIAQKWTANLSVKSVGRDYRKEFVTIGKENNYIDITLQDLLCIKSEGNYSEVFVLNQEQVTKKLLHCPLSQINHQLKKYTFIKQCHRSYIVNFMHAKKVSGNARNYSLHLYHLDFVIPVSRQFPKEILETLKD